MPKSTYPTTESESSLVYSGTEKGCGSIAKEDFMARRSRLGYWIQALGMFGRSNQEVSTGSAGVKVDD